MTEFNDVEFGIVYYSNEEDAYFIFIDYISWNTSLVGWMIKNIYADEYNVREEIISRDVWDAVDKKGRRTYTLSNIIQKHNAEITHQLINKIFRGF